MRVKYDAIYLVAERAERNSEHRVTKRKDTIRPRTIAFSGNFPIPANPDMTYGTLVLTEENWDEWFSEYDDEDFVDGMRTYEEAAETLVKSRSGINYGCPLCAYTTSSKEEADNHIDEHVNKFVKQFTFEFDYRCPYCGEEYKQAGSLQNHIEEKHITEEENND